MSNANELKDLKVPLPSPGQAYTVKLKHRKVILTENGKKVLGPPEPLVLTFNEPHPTTQEIYNFVNVALKVSSMNFDTSRIKKITTKMPKFRSAESNKASKSATKVEKANKKKKNNTKKGKSKKMNNKQKTNTKKETETNNEDTDIATFYVIRLD